MAVVIDSAPGAGTHVIIIGVGQYPHLPGGSGPLLALAQAENLGQLDSPPRSARALARWFLERFHHPQRPLRSLRVLTSGDDDPIRFLPDGDRGRVTDEPAAVEVQPLPATMTNVTEALVAWRERGEQDPDAVLLFFFSGHGLGLGADVSLLLRDFGARNTNPLAGAIDFRALRNATQVARASRQCWFVDACRVESPMLQNAGSYRGNPVFQPGPRLHAEPCLSTVFHSTLRGRQAYGRPGNVSLFTELLLEALEGGGASDLDGDGTYHVTPLQLQSVLGETLDRAARRHGALQIPVADGLSKEFEIHTLTGPPIVPTFVRCDPPAAHLVATLACRSGDRVEQRPAPEDADWSPRLQSGSWDFEASFPDGVPWRRGSTTRVVLPPFRNIVLPVTP